MNDLIAQVIQRLKQRQGSKANVYYRPLSAPPAEKVLLDNGQVILRGVAIDLIVDLYSINKDNPWVAWILQGIHYDVRFFFEINEQMINFVPRLMVLDWPIVFVVGKQHPLIASYHHLITRTELAALPDQAILIRSAKQLMTAEAKDICQFKNITVKVRADENCIWQK